MSCVTLHGKGQRMALFKVERQQKLQDMKPWISNSMINHDSSSFSVTKTKELENTENNNRDKRENH